MRSTHALLLLLLCLLGAAALRLPALVQIPPGVHFDEAANGILAGDIGLRGARPVFISSYTGKEVLFFYLAGGLMRLLGQSPFTLRLTAAFLGLLTVAATYWLGRELFPDRRVALLATLLLSLSFWHLLFSRLGFRAVSQPLLQALAAGWLLRAVRKLPAGGERLAFWQGGGWRFALAGIFLGATAYTYLAARLFPLLLLPSLALFLLTGRQRRVTLGLLLFVATALLVLLPLANTFRLNPEAFWVRIRQVAPTAGALSPFQGYVKSLGMFFLAGDPYWRFNLPGRPLFSWFWGGLLLLGWLHLWPGGPRRQQVRHQAGRVLLLLAPFIMILPTALATNEILPSNLRAIGLIPFVFYLPALALARLLQWLASRLPRLGYRLFPAAALAILLVGLPSSATAYFRQWGQRADVYYETDADLGAVATFLGQWDLEGKTVYVAARHYRHPTLAFLSQAYDRLKWLPGSQAIVFPAAGPALYIYPHSSPAPGWALPLLQQGRRMPGPPGPDGQATFVAYELDGPPASLANMPAEANFGLAALLAGVEVEAAAAGTPLPVTLTWQVAAVPALDFSPFLHLEDQWGARWSQAEPFAYPTEQWTPGEVIVQRVELPLPAGMPPGSYRLRLGLFDRASGSRLPLLDEAGRYAGTAYAVEAVMVTAGAVPDPLPAPPAAAPATARAGGLVLLGYEPGADRLPGGGRLELAFWWLGQSAPLPPARLQVWLDAPGGSGRLLLEGNPVHGTAPFATWPVPAFLIDRQEARVPPEMPAGTYQLRLQLVDESGSPLLEQSLGPLTVEASRRSFALPPLSHQVGATLGEEIGLAGYNLQPGQERGRFRLELVWQSLAVPATDYTVFVHVLQEDGRCCLWQADGWPQAGQYATSGWLAGEVVTDPYDIRLPADVAGGSYPVEVGLYLADTGRRLQARLDQGEQSDAIFLLPLEVK